MDTQSTEVEAFDPERHMSRTRAHMGVEAGLRSAMENGEIDRETAKSLYDYIEAELNTGWANPFTSFEVTVSLWGDDILSVIVEADDEQSACDEVSDNISLDDLNISFNIETTGGNGAYGSFDGGVSSWSNIYDSIVEHLEFSATEVE